MRPARSLACAVICAAHVRCARRLRAAQSARRRSTCASPIYAVAGAVHAGAVSRTARSSRRRSTGRCSRTTARANVGDSLTIQIVEKISATQKSTSSIDKSGKLDGGDHRAAGRPAELVQSRQRRPAARATPSPAPARPPTATSSPARSPPSSPGCCRTATCWSPARSRSASTTARVHPLLGPGRPAIDPERQHGAVDAGRQRAHRVARPRRPGRGAGDRLARRASS